MTFDRLLAQATSEGAMLALDEMHPDTDGPVDSVSLCLAVATGALRQALSESEDQLLEAEAVLHALESDPKTDADEYSRAEVDTRMAMMNVGRIAALCELANIATQEAVRVSIGEAAAEKGDAA